MSETEPEDIGAEVDQTLHIFQCMIAQDCEQQGDVYHRRADEIGMIREKLKATLSQQQSVIESLQKQNAELVEAINLIRKNVEFARETEKQIDSALAHHKESKGQ